ncbi:trafficking protein particle complex subunit 2-like protein [Rhodotorula paludigena]|uniref:trafficking protein particle complex subunit 2-like protein n=1 Tax=Rhodotorula paludigena TaxID=86838 RepID=UPI00317FA9EB
MSLAVLSIAVLGRQGNPLFLESYSQRQGGTADLKWHYAAHTALDFFDEREAPAAKSTESYLGLLYAMEDYAVYGYQTNTRIKFVLALALADAVIRDVDVKTIFRAIHNAYIAHLSNPFTAAESDNPAVLAAPIRSRKFAAAMAAIAGRAPAAGGD